MPKDQFFDQFSDFNKLKKEQGKILELFSEIESRMQDLSRQGVRINFANSIKDIEDSIKSLEKTAAELGVVRKEYAISSAKIIQANENESRRSKELTRQLALERLQRSQKNKELMLEAAYLNAAEGSMEKYVAGVAFFSNELKKLGSTEESDIILQDTLNKRIAEFNRLIDERNGKKITGSVQQDTNQNQPIIVPTNIQDVEEYNKTLQKQGDVVSDLEKEQAALVISSNEWADSQKKVAESSKTIVGGGISDEVVHYKDALEEVTGTLGQNQKILATYKHELSQTTQEISDLELSTSKAEKATPRYQNKIEQLRKAESGLKQEIKDTNFLIKQQIIEQNSSAGSVQKLQARYELLTISLNNMSAAQRKSSVGRVFIQESKDIDRQIQKIKESSGQLSATTLNMTNSMTRSLGRGIGFLRNIAYLIPGLGIGGLIAIFSEQIEKFVTTLFDLGKGIDVVTLSKKTLNKAFESTEYTQAIESVNKLRIEIDLAKRGFINKKDVVDEYNKTIGETTGKVNSLEEAEKALQENADAYIQFTLLKAAANIALAEAAKKAVDIAQYDLSHPGQKEEEQTLLFPKINKKDRDQYVKLYNSYSDDIADAVLNKDKETEKFLTEQRAALKERFTKAFFTNKTKEEKENLESVAKKFLEDASKFKFDFFGNKDKSRAAGKSAESFADDLAKIRAEISKADFEALKQSRQDIIKYYEDIANDSSKGLYERYAASQEYYNKQKELLDLNLQYEIEANQKAIKAEKEKYQEKLNAKNSDGEFKFVGKQREDLNDILLELDNKLIANEKKIKSDYNKDIFKLDENSAKQRTIIFKTELENKKKLIEEEKKFREEHTKSQNDIELSRIQNNYDEQQYRLDQKFAKGLISERQYNREKLRIEAEAQKATLEAEINQTVDLIQEQEKRFKAEEDEIQRTIDLEKIKASLIVNPDAQADRYKKIAEAEKGLANFKIKNDDAIAASAAKLNALLNKYHSINLDVFKKGSKATAEEYLKTFQQISDAAKETFEIIGGFIHARSELEKNAVQEQIDLLEEKRQKDIETAEQTITSERDRTDAIIRINALADANKTRLEIKQRQIQERDARFQKASTIASIIQETALAVVRALGSKPYTPANIALAAITGALGAAQLAVAIATPIPKYAKGGTLEKTKTIELAENGRELAVGTDGKLTLYEKPTITTLAGGTKILPNRVTEDVLRSNKGVHQISKPKIESIQVDRTDEVLTELRAIKKRVKVVVINTVPIETTQYYLENLKGKR